MAALGLQSGSCATVALEGEIERARFTGTHTAGGEPKQTGTWLELSDGADEVALVAPELEQAATVGEGDRVARSTEIEERKSVFEDERVGMRGKERSDGLGEGLRGGIAHALPLLCGAEFGDMGGMVASVPLVKAKRVGQSLTAVDRMDVATMLEIVVG